MDTTYDQLIEMGFEKIKVEQALKYTNNEGLQAAIDWMESHETEDNFEKPTSISFDVEKVEENSNEGDQNQALSKSMKCDDCGKLLLTTSDMQFHASRVGHIHFSESTEEVKPLTDEEKKFQMEKLQEKLKQKRLERETQEAKESLEREKYRRKQGKTIIDAKTKFEEDELKRLADQKKREKEEDRLYREKLKNQIAHDREMRKQNTEITKQKDIQPPKPLEMTPVVGNYDTCRIQIRYSQGNVMETFSANDSLSKVASLFAQRTALCSENEIEFRTTMPSKLYGAECMNRSIKDLGFCPSIVLMAVIKKSTN